ncbi:MAG: hypothetical protein LIP09_12300 [Bacteroidales bacterium]|nr:hypothetical protein [Bacteroidales bacterium]
MRKLWADTNLPTDAASCYGGAVDPRLCCRTLRLSAGCRLLFTYPFFLSFSFPFLQLRHSLCFTFGIASSPNLIRSEPIM